MEQETINAAIVGAIVASAGLWWFRLMLPNVRTMAKPTRFGIYALIWLAYFILIIIVIKQRSGA
ncbi:MAG: hypothetical protein R3C58_04680 [Parvularculaceae bacterium]